MKYIGIHFRLATEKEKMAVEQAAKSSGKTVSDYCRDILLSAADYEVTEVICAEKESLKSDSEDRLKEEIHIRISEEERAFYIEQAKKGNCTVSDYIRSSAKGNVIYVMPGLKDVAKQLAKLGTNINQLTVLAHQGKIKEVDLFSCNDTLKQILKQIIQLNKKKKG